MLKINLFIFFTIEKGIKMNRKLFLLALVLVSGCFLFNGCTTHNAAMTFHQDAPVSW